MNFLITLSIFLIVFLNVLPDGMVTGVADLGHFFSSIHMFEYAASNNLQFGVDILDNVGPFGYLHYPSIYFGGAYTVKTIWYTFICFVYSYHICRFVYIIRSWPERLIFILALTFLLPAYSFVSYEVIPRLAITFSALHFISEYDEKSSWSDYIHATFTAIFFALLTLEKASNIYYIVLLVFVLSAFWIQRCQWRNALYFIFLYLLTIVGLWVLSGQHLSNIALYFKSIILFIDAYQETLAQETSARDLSYALFYGCITITISIYRLKASVSAVSQKNLFYEECFRAVIFLSFFFLTWKHGMFRGTSSYAVLLYTVPVLFGYICLYPAVFTNGHNRTSSSNPLPLISFLSMRVIAYTALLLVILSNVFHHERETGHKFDKLNEFRARVSAVLNYQPLSKLSKLQSELEEFKRQNELPVSLKNILHTGCVDEFGSVPEIIFLNSLHYCPRPVPITFMASNIILNKLNGLYYQNNTTAPDYLLLDGGFGFRAADSLAYLSILFNYQTFERFKNWLVLEKRPGDWQTLSITPVKDSNSRFDEWIYLGSLDKYFLWAELDIDRSLLGKIKKFFYKPDFVRLDILLGDGSVRNVTTSVSQLHSGFLINPFLKTSDEIVLHGQDNNNVNWHDVKAIRVSLDNGVNIFLFNNVVKLKLSKIAVTSTSTGDSKQVDLINARYLTRLVASSFPVVKTRFPIDLLSGSPNETINITGLSGLERSEKESWRWALGPSTRVKFYVDKNLDTKNNILLLNLALKNGVPISKQTVTFRLNGNEFAHITHEEMLNHKLIELNKTFPLKSGVNNIEIYYRDWNHGEKDLANDPRQLAVVFTRFSLSIATK